MRLTLPLSMREMVDDGCKCSTESKDDIASAVADERNDGADDNRSDAASEVHAHEKRRVGFAKLVLGCVARNDRLDDRLSGSDAETDEGR